MPRLNLFRLADRLLGSTGGSSGGRAAETVHGGRQHALQHTVLALSAGGALAEHESPGEATLLVLRGAVRLATATRSWHGQDGDLLVIPPEQHSLTAIADAAVLLTVARC